LRITTTNTDAGVREVDLTPALQELLTEYRRRSPHTKPGDFVFPTSEGKRDNPSMFAIAFWIRQRSWSIPICGRGGEQMPDVTPHSLRRTFISSRSQQGLMCLTSWRRPDTLTRR